VTLGIVAFARPSVTVAWLNTGFNKVSELARTLLVKYVQRQHALQWMTVIFLSGIRIKVVYKVSKSCNQIPQ
jgi:hypothetical protein